MNPISKVQSSCVCVLGMHRSGTSCLTGILQGFGVKLGEVHEQNRFNKQGNREHPRIMALNDDVLAGNGGAWDRPVPVTRWTDAQKVERDDIIDELSSDTDQFWGFKDPRTLLSFDFWAEGVGSVDRIKMIGSFRHPLRVAASLAHRSRLSLEHSLSLWNAYNERLIAMARQHEFSIVNFDLEPEAYLKDVEAKLSNIGLRADEADAATGFFNQALRNQTSKPIDQSHVLPEKTTALYQELLDLHARDQT